MKTIAAAEDAARTITVWRKAGVTIEDIAQQLGWNRGALPTWQEIAEDIVVRLLIEDAAGRFRPFKHGPLPAVAIRRAA